MFCFHFKKWHTFIKICKILKYTVKIPNISLYFSIYEVLGKSYAFIFYIRPHSLEWTKVQLHFSGRGDVVDLTRKGAGLSYNGASTVVPHFILPTRGDFRISSFWFRMYSFIDQRQPLWAASRNTLVASASCGAWMLIQSIWLRPLSEQAAAAFYFIVPETIPGLSRQPLLYHTPVIGWKTQKLWGDILHKKGSCKSVKKKKRDSLGFCYCIDLQVSQDLTFSRVMHAGYVLMHQEWFIVQGGNCFFFFSWGSFLTFGILKANNMFQR